MLEAVVIDNVSKRFGKPDHSLRMIPQSGSQPSFEDVSLELTGKQLVHEEDEE